MHAIRVKHGQSADRNFAAGKFIPAFIGVPRRVDHGESDIGAGTADQLEIVDRTTGDFGTGLIAGQTRAEHVGERATERVIDPAGAAGSDG